MKRILVINFGAGGHHPRYVRWILESEALRESAVVLAGPRELIEHAELKDLGGQFEGHELELSPEEKQILGSQPSTLSLIRKEFAVWKIWRRVYDSVSESLPIDLVLLPCFDDGLEAIGLIGTPFRKSRFMGITLRVMFHFQQLGVSAPKPRLSIAREWLFKLALSHPLLDAVFTNDPTLDEYARAYLTPRLGNKISYLFDPQVKHELPPRADARAALGIPDGARVVLLYGVLTERKGARVLLDAACSPQCPENIFLLLAGRVEPEMLPFLHDEATKRLKEQNRLVVMDRYIDDADEAQLLAAADCMWVGYLGFYQLSGIQILAGRHGIPCIVSDFGIAGYMMKKYKVGISIDPDDPSSVLEALRLVSCNSHRIAQESRHAEADFARYSCAEFQNGISRTIANITPRQQRFSD